MKLKLANVRISELANGAAYPLIRQFANSLILFLLFANYSSAQSVSAILRADSTHILIGDQLNVKLIVKHTKGLEVVMPATADTLGNMEVVNTSKTDTGEVGTDQVLTRTYTVSAFDSGTFHAGPLSVVLKKATGETDTIHSNDIPVEVFTVPVDTAKAFKPIKAPLEIPYSWKEFIPYIIAGVAFLVLVVVGFVLWRRYQKQKPSVVERPKPKEPAHIWARTELKKLEEEKIWQKGEMKLYYTRLTDILRLYLEYRYNWLALESTTEEIEEAMKDYNLKEKAKDNLLEILRAADLVKFAKSMPMPDMNMRMMESAYKFIDFTEPNENKTEATK